MQSELFRVMSVFAARMTPRSSDWLALGDGRYGNELRQQQQPMPPVPCQRHVRPATFGETESVKAHNAVNFSWF